MSFWNDWFGGGNATRDAQAQLQAGYDASRGFVLGGQDQARGDYGQGWNLFQQYLTPYSQGGNKGYDTYLNALGINGAGSQAEVQNQYLNSPVGKGITNLTMQGINRAYAPTGQGGAAMQAATNALLGNWNNYVGQLGGVANQGVQTAGMLANTGNQYGGKLANLDYGTAQLLANLRTGLGNSNAQAGFAGASINLGGWNALLQAIGAGAKGFGGFGGGFGGGGGWEGKG